MKRVGVVGSRIPGRTREERMKHPRWDAVVDFVATLRAEDVTVVTGDADGSDEAARVACAAFGIRCEVHAADWDKHGNAAGPIRNGALVASGLDRLVALWDGKSRGTKDTITKALAAGVPRVDVRIG